jgi:hypothetical protein
LTQGRLTKDATENTVRTVKGKLQAIAALRLRAEGASCEMIRESLIPSVSRQRAFRIVQRCLREEALKWSEKIDNLRQLELFRLERLIQVLDPNRSDPRVADVQIRISALIARLGRLDAPSELRRVGRTAPR